ncbi:hypothetical protein LCGC14_0376450 [marine sediment metagenome]|uniref:Uncharacterized protein n=1 Tax=marine sediment metagenome TaxID=412755 RepID=A0A0F9T9C9_9ZZZZ
MDKELKERIKKLKDPRKVQPYWIRSKEEQGVLFDAGIKNTLQVTKNLPDGSAHGRELSVWCDQLLILKPGYEPESEYEKCLVFVNSANGRLSVSRSNWDYARDIGDIVSEPDFYLFHDVHTGTDSHIPGHIPGWIRQGHDVHAWFVKD